MRDAIAARIVPEPGTGAMVAAGLVVVALARRRPAARRSGAGASG